MLFRRLGLRLLKLLLFIVLTWIGAALLYLSLPSPVPNDSSVTASLRQGKPTYRVYNVDTFWPWGDIHPSVEEARRMGKANFIMEYKYFKDLGILAFGGGSDPLDIVNGVTNPPTPYHNLSISSFTETEKSTSISNPIRLSIPVADNDGSFVPSWIATADGTLLDWWANHGSTEMAFVVRRVPSKRLVEIWPDSGHWYRVEASPESTPPGLGPLFSIQLEPLSFTFPSLPDSSSPSVLYPIRLGLLLFLLPVGAIGILIATALRGILHGILDICVFFLNIAAFGVVVAVIYGVYWWIKNERPRMIIAMADIQEGIHRTLDNARARGEAMHEQELVSASVDIEAQTETVESKVPEVLFDADVKDGASASRA